MTVQLSVQSVACFRFARSYAAEGWSATCIDRLVDVSKDASAAKAAFIRSTSMSDISSRFIRELRAIPLTRISSSNFNCIAWVSRLWVFWITNTIKKVTIVVPVLMTSCQVSDQPKSGPETAQSRTTAIASTKVDERPTCRSTQRANRAKSGVALVSTSEVGSEDPSGINQPSIFQCPFQTRMHRILFQLGGIFPGL